MGGLPRTHHGEAIVLTLRRAAYAWLVGGVLWFALEAVAARAFAGYDYARFYISDLANPARETYDGRPIASSLAWVMNLDLVVHGTLFLAGALFASRAAANGRARHVFVALVALNALGSIVVATVHSSNATVANGSIGWHELGALFSIVCGNLAIVVAGAFAAKLDATPAFRIFSIVLALAGIVSFAMLLGGSQSSRSTPGLWERGAVYTIMLWEIVTAATIFRSNPRSKAALAAG